MIRDVAPPLRRKQLRSGLGGYRSLLSGMLQAMRSQPRLARFNSAEPRDSTYAIVGAWARVCDVLGFYQDRLASEGYLTTSTEPESVIYLAEAVGTVREGAVSAQVPLALTLLDIPGQPDQLALGPGRSLSVQNLPEAGQQPVVFECNETITLRRSWNSFGLANETVLQRAELAEGSTSLLLQGTATGVRFGDGLVLQLNSSDQPDPAVCHVLVRICDVQPDRSSNSTLVVWQGGLPNLADAIEDLTKAATEVPFTAPYQVVAIDRLAPRGGLFGRTAQAWEQVPPAARDAIGACPGGVIELERDPLQAPPWLWRKPQRRMPPGPLRQVFAPSAAALLVGTAQGIFQAEQQGGWIAPALPPGRHDVRAFAEDGAARLYAGTAAGLLLQSVDGGASWAELQASMPVTAGSNQAKAGLPGPIHCLYTEPGQPAASARLIAGTDLGLWALTLDGSTWHSYNSYELPGYVKGTGTAGLSVFAVCRFADWLIAATSQGLFKTPYDINDWQALSPPGPSGQPFQALAVSKDGTTLFAGGSSGVVAMSDREKWHPFNKMLDGEARNVSSLAVFGSALFAASPAGIYASRVEAAHWLAVSREDLELFQCPKALVDEAELTKGNLPDLLTARLQRAGIAFQGVPQITKLAGLKAGETRWRVSSDPLLIGSRPLELRLTIGEHVRVAIVVDLGGAGPAQLYAAHGRLMATMASQPAIDREWPGYLIEHGRVALNRQLEAAKVGDRILLDTLGGGNPRISLTGPLLRVVDGCEGVIGGFGRKSVATQLRVADQPELVTWDLRRTEVLRAEGSAVGVAPPLPSAAPFTAATGRFAVPAAGLTDGRMLVLSGPRAALVVLPLSLEAPALGQGPALGQCAIAARGELDQGRIGTVAAPALAAAGLNLTRAAQVWCRQPAKEWLLRDGDQLWRLTCSAGQTTIAIAPVAIFEALVWSADQARCWIAGADGKERRIPKEMAVVWLDPVSWQHSQAELAFLTGPAVECGPQCAQLSLQRRAAIPFAAATLQLSANIVMADQGEKVSGEVLGSTQINRKAERFRLARRHLAHRRDQNGLTAQLAVVVNGPGGMAQLRDPGSARLGEIWRPLDESEPGDGRRFSLSIDAEGHGMLDFSAAASAGSLPPGRDHVVAHYFSCAGASGNVAAGTLQALRSRPPGVRRVTNPFPASGGTDPESIEHLRKRAPRRLTYAKRIVTLADYAAFAGNFPGVAAVHVEHRGRSGVAITLAEDAGWTGLEPLREAIMAARADNLPLTLLLAKVQGYGLELTPRFEPTAQHGTVVAQLQGLLLERLTGPAVPIGQAISRDDIARIAAQVPGLAGVGSIVFDHRPAERADFDQSRGPGTGAVQFRLDPTRLRIVTA